MDFLWQEIRGTTHIIMHIVDCSTGFSEATIIPSRNLITISQKFENLWINKHGPPASFSADYELNKEPIKKLLAMHSIMFNPRPARRHNKIGHVERKNGTLRTVLHKLNLERSSADAETIVARAVFLSNLFSGSRLASSFEQVRGYTPAVAGLPQTFVPKEIIDAHKEQVAIRTLERLLRSKRPHTVKRSALPPGTEIWYFHKSSKQNERDQWLPAKVVEAKEHIIMARRTARGPPLQLAYEDVRIAPKNALTKKLLQSTLEDAMLTDLGAPSTTEALDTTPITGGNTELTSDEPESELMDELPVGGVGGDNDDDKGQPAVQPTLITTTLGEPSKDIGQRCIVQEEAKGTLASNRQHILRLIKQNIGTSQVNRNDLDFAPPWIVDETFQSELTENWATAYQQVDEADVPLHSNVITSHVVYKIKQDEAGTLKLKARIVPHGNRDPEKSNIRKDSMAVQFDAIRLKLSMAATRNFRLMLIDVKGAYLQSGNIGRRIYIHPPKEYGEGRRKLWRLIKLPYGIVEAGRQWMLTCENWLLSHLKFRRVPGVQQLFVHGKEGKHFTAIMAKATDDFLLAGDNTSLAWFKKQAQMRFKIGTVNEGNKINFFGTEITRLDNGDIEFSMKSYMRQVEYIPTSRARLKQSEQAATDEERTALKSLSGTLIFLGNGTLPQASYVASRIQQSLGHLKVKDIKEANRMVKELMQLNPTVTFRTPTSNIKEVTTCSFSDASFNIGKSQSYGQSGIISGMLIKTTTENIYHVIDWASKKQRRVSYSSYGAEILACSDADDRGYYLRNAIRILTMNQSIKHELCVDSRGLYDTITTLHDGKEYRLRQTVERLRNSFESGDLNILRWIPGTMNIADALTKRNIQLYKMLNNVCASGKLNIEIDQGYSLASKTWK